jgi:hypothetical protein
MNNSVVSACSLHKRIPFSAGGEARFAVELIAGIYSRVLAVGKLLENLREGHIHRAELAASRLAMAQGGLLLAVFDEQCLEILHFLCGQPHRLSPSLHAIPNKVPGVLPGSSPGILLLVRNNARGGIQSAPGAALRVIKLTLFLLGTLFK